MAWIEPPQTGAEWIANVSSEQTALQTKIDRGATVTVGVTHDEMLERAKNTSTDCNYRGSCMRALQTALSSSHRMRNFIGLLSLAMALNFAVPVAANQFDDGKAAFVRKDYAAALQFLRPLADQGDASAQTMMGLMYANGLGVSQDDTEAANWYRKAAESGDAKAQFFLGAAYTIGRGLAQDFAAGVVWLRKAADQGLADAQYMLAGAYSSGLGVAHDDKEAAKWDLKAADQGNSYAQFTLGHMYEIGEGLPQDKVQAYKWYTLSAINSSPSDSNAKQVAIDARDALVASMTSAQVAQAQQLGRDPVSVPDSTAHMAPLVVIPAAQADKVPLENDGGTYLVSVLVNKAISLKFILDTGASDVLIPADVLSTLMRTGTVKKTDFIGTGTYILADGSKLPSAQFVLRELKVGDQVVANVTASVGPVEGSLLLGQSFLSKLPRWNIDYKQKVLIIDGRTSTDRAQQSSPRDEPEKQITLGQFEEGTSAFRHGDYATALRIWNPLAEQGDGRAQFRVGFMYDYGLGVAQDNTEAIYWLRKSADQGLAEAQAQLGNDYLSGRGVPQNWIEAANWFRKAADQGNAHAAGVLGDLYSFGMNGVPKDYTESLKWLRMGADHGDANAQKSLGDHYAHGYGVPQDNAEAAKWYRKAADQHHVEAQKKLNDTLANGQVQP